MRIGIQAQMFAGAYEVPKAGVALYGQRLIETMPRLAPQHEFHVFVKSDFEVPEHWRSVPNLRFHRIWRKERTWYLLGQSLHPKLLGLDVFFSLADSIPRVPFVKRAVMIHDLFPYTYPDFYTPELRDRHQAWYRYSCHHADLLLANSEATRQSIATVFPDSKIPVVVTPLGPGNASLRPRPATTARGEIFLFSLSTLEPRKNFVRLLEAMKRLEGGPLGDIRLFIGGGKGWKYEPVFEKHAELGLGDRVQFLGYLPEARVQELMDTCAAYVCPSVDEGFGMPVLEAMQAGVPCVSSSGGALAEVGGDAIWSFDPLSVDDIARTIGACLADPEEQSRKIALGLKRAQTFNWESTAAKTLNALEGLNSN
jgi:glycosyltransferase involved in cell wall biosynthesis